METFWRICRFIGSACGLLITFVLSLATLALTNAYAPTYIKEMMQEYAQLGFQKASEQAIVAGVPEPAITFAKTHINIDQMVTMAYVTLTGLALAILALIGSMIWASIWSKKAKPASAPQPQQQPQTPVS